jgi:hypothetical protein
MKQYGMVEEDLSSLELIEVGTIIDMPITKRICITCTTQTSFVYFQKTRKLQFLSKPSYFEKWSNIGWIKRTYHQ